MNEMFQKLVKAVQLRDTTDECAIVRIVLETLREPTEEMIKAGELIGVEYGYISDHDYKSIWQRQIDEILK